MHHFIRLVVAISMLYGYQCTGRSALIVVDVQNCFTAGGTLTVHDGEKVIPVINDLRTRLGNKFHTVVLTQDWHCPDHVSFASQHPGYRIMDNLILHYNTKGNLCETVNVTSPYAINCTNPKQQTLTQTLWPDHCVINTTDANLRADLMQDTDDVIIKKGDTCDLDSYSIFFDNGGFRETEVQFILRDRGVTRVYLTGLATDFCVLYSARDAHRLGFETFVVFDATRGVAPQSTTDAVREMIALGVNVINSTDVESTLPPVSESTNILQHPIFVFGLIGLINIVI